MSPPAVFDPRSGVLRAALSDLGSLLAWARSADAPAASRPGPPPELVTVGALADAEAHPRLRSALRAAARPACRLRLERGGGVATCSMDGDAAALLIPARGDRGELRALPTGAVPAALADLLELGPRPRAAARARVPAPALAVVLADSQGAAAVQPQLGPDAPPAIARAIAALNSHWRVESEWVGAEPPPRPTLEIIDSDHGLWAVEPEAGDVRLEPLTTGEVWRRLSALFPRAAATPSLPTGPPDAVRG